MSIPGRQPGVPLRHQPSPGGFLLKGGVIGPPGSAGVPPASGTCRRFRPPHPDPGANHKHPLHHKPETGFTSCQAMGQGALCWPQESLPPGGGVGEIRAQPAVEPVGERFPLASLFTGKMNIDAQDAQDFFRKRLARIPEQPLTRTGSSAEPASRAGTSRPVHPVYRCS